MSAGTGSIRVALPFTRGVLEEQWGCNMVEINVRMGEEKVSTNDAFKVFAAKKSRGVASTIFCLSLWLQGEPPLHILYKCS